MPGRIIDISMPIQEGMLLWPGDPRVRLRRPLHLARGDAVTLTALEMCAHAGTHIDAPSHYIMDGPDTAALPLGVFVGPAVVIDGTGCALLEPSGLERAGIPPAATRVLLRTDNSERRLLQTPTFHEDYAALSPDGAGWLIRRGIRLIGIDYLSIGPYQGGEETHRILLHAGIAVVEGLVLSHVRPGPYRLVCLPLPIEGVDGAPARALLIDEHAPS